MNSLIKQKIKIQIDEPFNKSETIHGQILEVNKIGSRTYITISFSDRTDFFILSERYKEESFSTLWQEKRVHVAIYHTDKNILLFVK